MCGGQKATRMTLLALSTLWVPGLELRLSGLDILLTSLLFFFFE